MTSKSVRFEDEPPMTPASWRSRPRTGQSLSGFDPPQRPLTGTSTPRPRTSGSVRFADEVEVEDLEDPLQMMSQTAPAALYSNEELFNSSDPLEKKVARMELHFRTDVDEWLTENGGFVVLNNGIEFAATYLIMLLVLFFIGGGKYVSLDYWIAQRFPAGRVQHA